MRKKQETGGTKSKELFTSKDRPVSPRHGLTTSKTADEFSESDFETAEFGSPASLNRELGRAQLEDSDLANADWASDTLDTRVQTVSSDDEVGVESALPLLDHPQHPPTTADLFNETDATVKAQKPSFQPENTQQRPGRASFDGTSEHPWSQKAPTVARSMLTTQPAAKRPLVDIESSETTADSISRVASTPKTKSTAAKPTQPDDAQQAEAKARVRTLLTQSRSLLNKGEHRSAFRVAQLAQRIADSENLFFAAGEEQPADMVRSVLMKIRSEEQQIVSSHRNTDETQEEHTTSTKRVTTRTTDVRSRPGTSLANLETTEEETVSTESTKTPWAVTTKKSPVQPVMRISPGSASRGSRFNDQFPKSRTEWQSTPNEPQTLSSPEGEVSPGLATAKDGRLEPYKVVQAKLNSSPSADALAKMTSGFSNHEHAPLPFPAKAPTRESTQRFELREQSSSEPLAVAEDWRTQDLNHVATSQQPLLVAPLPPDEPLIPSVLTDSADEIFAVEVEEPSNPQPASRLWMILAAAAGAFAMLFVRRRPAPVVRASGDFR